MAVDQATGDNTTTTPSNDEQAEVATTDAQQQGADSGEQPANDSNQGDSNQGGDNGNTDKGAEQPVTYDLKAPEGYDFADGELEAITDRAKELGLSNEQAQALVEMKAEWSQRSQDEAQASLGKLAESWAEQVKADKEFGGERFNESLQDVKRAMDGFASDELKAALDETGFGNHPELFRFVARIGKALREDGSITANGGNSSPRTPASVMYPSKEDS